MIHNILFINILSMAIWHLTCFLLCVYLNPKHFNYKKQRYQAKAWEQNGKWYANNLKIKAWKDKLPQHIGKNGFSKARMTHISIDYLNEFIFETCRAEWNHSYNCLFVVVTLIISPLGIGLFFVFLTLIINLPFIAIQRYNRFRLIAAKEKLIRINNKNSKQKAT